MNVEQELLEHEQRIQKLETWISGVQTDVATIKGAMQSIELLVKYVIVPMLIIVGALVGIKLFA